MYLESMGKRTPNFKLIAKGAPQVRKEKLSTVTPVPQSEIHNVGGPCVLSRNWFQVAGSLKCDYFTIKGEILL